MNNEWIKVNGLYKPKPTDPEPEQEPPREPVLTVECKECNEPVLIYKEENQWGAMQTSVGYGSPPGHNHDDNCLLMVGRCSNGHLQKVSKLRKCTNPDCNWKGKTECFCHPGQKVDEWPWAPGEEDE